MLISLRQITGVVTINYSDHNYSITEINFLLKQNPKMQQSAKVLTLY